VAAKALRVAVLLSGWHGPRAGAVIPRGDVFADAASFLSLIGVKATKRTVLGRLEAGLFFFCAQGLSNYAWQFGVGYFLDVGRCALGAQATVDTVVFADLDVHWHPKLSPCPAVGRRRVGCPAFNGKGGLKADS